MDDPKCPDCDTPMVIEAKGGYEQSTQYEAHCTNCLLSYSWWDTEFDKEDDDNDDELDEYLDFHHSYFELYPEEAYDLLLDDSDE